MSHDIKRTRTVESWDEEGAIGPPGAAWLEAEQAWNFTLFSKGATGVTLLLYGATDCVQPVFQFQLDPLRNKTARIWHCRVPRNCAPAAKYYAYRVQGPWDPKQGHRFDPEKILFDPYVEEVFFPPDFSRAAAMKPGANDGRAPLGVCREIEAENRAPSTRPPRGIRGTRLSFTSCTSKGFTARANSGVAKEKRGTFLGVIEKIPYLKELGVTVVELLPVHQFDPQEGNYWGYMTLNFFAPHQGYGVHDAAAEFREMVRAFHAGGNRGVARRGVQPHVRRRPRPARRIRGAGSTTAVTTCIGRMDNTATTAVAETRCGADATPRAC